MDNKNMDTSSNVGNETTALDTTTDVGALIGVQPSHQKMTLDEYEKRLKLMNEKTRNREKNYSRHMAKVMAKRKRAAKAAKKARKRNRSK